MLVAADYRSQPLVCPACTALLEPHAIEDCLVDTCPGCAGIWIDWDDGPIHSVARRVQARAKQPKVAPEWQVPRCPRCHVPLVVERFETGSLAVVVHRCGDCAGAFVDHQAAQMLAATRPASMDSDGASQKGVLARLTAALKDLMFGNSEA